MALWAASEAFFAKHLGGRAQKDMTPEVSKRLGEITVDPKTVVLAKVIDAKSVGAPKPEMDLVAGTSAYQADHRDGPAEHVDVDQPRDQG